jgi:hypothetical protein
VQSKRSRRLSRAQEVAIIKDVLVWLDGGISDEIRLAALDEIAQRLDSQMVIGLFLVLLPLPGPVDADVSGALATAELLNLAREAGDKTEATLAKRLRQLDRPVEIRRFDILADDVARVAAREARSADTFVALRPNGAMTRSTGFSAARFCAIEPDAPHQQHDALSFPDGKAVLVNVLSEGQHARVLQLPVIPRESVDGHAEEGSLPPSSIMVFLTYRPARLATRAPLVSLP